MNDGEYHRLVISIKAIHELQEYTLPWLFRFKVDLFYCCELISINIVVVHVIILVCIAVVESELNELLLMFL